MEKDSKKLIINLILDEKNGENGNDLKKFLDIKDISGITKPNTEILRECIRNTHKLLLG